METFDSLWSYCQKDNRAIPREWNKLWNMLSNKKQKPNGSWEPPLPLILAAWDTTAPFEKVQRFKEHLRWAEKEDQLDEIAIFLRSLSESEWYHYGELPN